MQSLISQKPSIKIYCDEGVEESSLPILINELSSWKTACISSKDIIQTSWDLETSLLIIPGGRDIPFHEALKGEGNRRIKRYVEEGGSFLGICAGAYYGSGTVEFDLGMELEVLGARELAFFPGIARGPAYGLGSFRYDSEFGARASLISNCFNEEVWLSYYNGGCYFVEASSYSHVNIISRYLDIQGHPAAIIEARIGKGKAILSGVHIEIGTSCHFSNLTDQMFQKLVPFEAQRKRFFHYVLGRLLRDLPN